MSPFMTRNGSSRFGTSANDPAVPVGLTSSMTVRYLRSMRLGQELLAEGWIQSEEKGVTTIKATLSQAGKVGCSARISYAMPDCAKMVEVLNGPLPEGWDKFFGGTG